MKKFISYNKNKLVKILSTCEFEILNSEDTVIETNDYIDINQKILNKNKGIRLAYICNWNQQCGISTYSKFVLDELKFMVDEYQIFSEHPYDRSIESGINYCWKRGQYLKDLLIQIKNYNPSIILIQHEWGIFPNAGYFMSFITEVKKLNIPIISVLHSVYNHLDKLIPISILDNVIVHSDGAKNMLYQLNFKGSVWVIPHGCKEVKKYDQLWNIFQNPYLIFGYGFGFKYKGIEVAIDAIKYLKETDEKFKNILYIYVCSESDNNKGVHENYYNLLSNKVESYGLQENVLIIRGYLEEEMLDNYLRMVKMAIFPYISDPNNNVFGSSGAIKIAMSYNIPVIASKSHLFDDIDGYIIRISDYIELANEIDKIFSDEKYKNKIINDAHRYIENNTWKKSAEKYFNIIENINYL